MDERIGSNNALPRVDVFGNPAEHPATTRHIGGGAVVVIPRFASPESIERAIDDLRATITPTKDTDDEITSDTDSNL